MVGAGSVDCCYKTGAALLQHMTDGKVVDKVKRLRFHSYIANFSWN